MRVVCVGKSSEDSSAGAWQCSRAGFKFSNDAGERESKTVLNDKRMGGTVPAGGRSVKHGWLDVVMLVTIVVATKLYFHISRGSEYSRQCPDKTSQC